MLWLIVINKCVAKYLLTNSAKDLVSHDVNKICTIGLGRHLQNI